MAKTVLIVEDDPDIHFFYETTLSVLDIKIIKAYNGEEALRVLDSGEHIDLIVLDIIMPVLDGLGFLKIIRDERRLPIPVIVSTVDEVAAINLLKAGTIKDYFLKLDSLEKFKELIRVNCSV